MLRVTVCHMRQKWHACRHYSTASHFALQETGTAAACRLLVGHSGLCLMSLLQHPPVTPFFCLLHPTGATHVAEKLNIPLHIVFTMPWTPTKLFPCPMAGMNTGEGGRGHAATACGMMMAPLQ